MKTMNLPPIGGPLIVTLLICGGFWLYTEWDIKRFKESISSPVQRASRETTPVQDEALPQENTPPPENVAAVPTQLDVETEHSPPVAATPDAATVAEAPAADADFDSFLEEMEAASVASGDFTDGSEDAPYDMAFVIAGFDDYNAYLKTDPEYAYQRLDAAFREQYGDDSDVDVLVGHIRESNEGPTTIADAITFAEAMIRLTSKISPPEALVPLESHLLLLRETQQMALEQGTENLLHQNVMYVGE